MRLSVISSLFQKKLYTEVIRLIDQSTLNYRGKLNPKILYYRALSYSNIGEHQLALQALDKVIIANLGISYNYQCKMLKGYLYSMLKEFEDAYTTFEDLIADGYESTMVYGALGHVAFHLQRREKAIQYLEKALEIDKENINALNSLSYILTEYNIDINKASEYIVRVLKKEPNNASYLDTYGYILYKLNKYKEARRVLEFAYSIKPHETIKSHLEILKKL